MTSVGSAQLRNKAQAACQRSKPLISMSVLPTGWRLRCSVEEQMAEQFCCATKQSRVGVRMQLALCGGASSERYEIPDLRYVR
jgi:hypothetical protein